MTQRSIGGFEISVPALVGSTVAGNLLFSPPHLLAEVPRCDACPLLGQLELADVIGKDFGDTSLSSLQPGLERPLLIASSRHMSRGVGVCSKLGLDIDAPGGRKTITPAKLAMRADIDRPWVVISPADEVPMTSGAKRVTKSTERTMSMFKQLVVLPAMQSQTLFGVAVAGHTEGHVATMAAEMVRLGAKGIIVGGANLGESPEQLRGAIARVRAAVGPDVPLLVQGADSMGQMLLALGAGVDLISSNLPALATARGQALMLPSCCSAVSTASGPSGSPDSKKPRTEKGEATLVGRFGPVLDLWDSSHRLQQQPLLSDCTCHCCRNHTRAYLHHLLRAKELLAEVLLYAHNQHCLLGMMSRAREATAAGTLEQLLTAVQHTEEDPKTCRPSGTLATQEDD